MRGATPGLLKKPRIPASAAAVLIVLTVAFLFATAMAPARAEAAPAGRAPAEPAQIGIPNPTNWLLQHIFVNPFKSSVKKTIATALKSSEVAFQTPDVSTQPRVREIWQSLLIVSDSLLLLLFVVGTIMVVSGNWSYLTAKELAPRAFLSALAVNLSLVLLGEGIGVSNALVRGFLQVDPNSLSVTTDRLVQSGVVAPLVLALLLIGALFLLVSNLIRVVMVVLLGIVGPLLNVFGILPQTEYAAMGWWRAAAACLLAPAAQALLLTIGVKVFFSDGGAALGTAAASNAGSSVLVDLLVVLVIIGLMAYIPLWMLKTAVKVTHRHITASVNVVASAAGVGA